MTLSGALAPGALGITTAAVSYAFVLAVGMSNLPLGGRLSLSNDLSDAGLTDGRMLFEKPPYVLGLLLARGVEIAAAITVLKAQANTRRPLEPLNAAIPLRILAVLPFTHLSSHWRILCLKVEKGY